MQNFSGKYATFEEWEKKQNTKSAYFRTAAQRHYLYPQMPLSELRRLTDTDINTKMRLKRMDSFVLSTLTDSERKHYKAGLEIIARARQLPNKVAFDEFFKSLKSENNAYKSLQKSKIKKFAESAIDNDGYIKDTDRIERQMKFFNKYGQVSITIRGNEKASLVAKYNNAIKKYRDTGDYSALADFKGKYVLDIYGRKRYFITHKKLLDRFIEVGETDFYDIYVE
jgi:hypothetical protein